MTSSPQIWMITGAGRGLGRALAESALEAGHIVVATVRGEHELPAHDRLTIMTLDVRDRGAARDTVRRAVEHHGRIDVLVNNAGYGLIGAVEEASEDDIRSVMDTNLLGPLWLSQAVIPVMREQSGGHIVQISTVGAVGTMPLLGLYNSTKWGLEGFSEAMAAEVARFGIRVSLIEPGALDTAWAGPSMRFSSPSDVYDEQRTELFGTAEVPWPPGDSAGGTTPSDAAAAILAHVASDNGPLRVLIGDDAPEQVAAALDLRRQDYSRDPRFPGA
ncbi:SDR family NAD(P)-dependent oxidoreductase [Microbacterium sp. LMC-P-041]|uniref:SDR family NAD(P)-dependent oxidoreductase n=1 Tax=Microbacterium sp. LMC-P-041 TaxID=3040293 RepID=UPI0025544193|nr:SDR family NAD(P)-dependent oxidoreductase [Microbacterium sp. LMC-P-041]